MRTSVSLYFRVLTSLPLTPRILFHSPRHAECVIPPGRTGLRKTDGTTDYAIANKLTPFISMQNHYSLLYREEEREMLPTLKVRNETVLLCLLHNDCSRCTFQLFGVGAIPWSPLARGMLTRPFNSDSKRGGSDRYAY